MTVNDMDDDGRIKIEFSQKIYFELPLPNLRRSLLNEENEEAA